VPTTLGMRVLLVEDDVDIAAPLVRGLEREGFLVTHSQTGEGALAASGGPDAPDVVLLDLGLPDLDGASLLAMIRAVSDVPVIVVSARDDGAGIVALLDAGADDYLVKPFAADQLEARIRAVLRRTETEDADEPIRVGDLAIDAMTRHCTLGDREVELSRREFDLLLLLAQRAGEVVTKREILEEVWNQPYGGGERTVDVHLSWLRRKLGETAAHPAYLHSVRGVGVRLAAPSDAVDGEG